MNASLCGGLEDDGVGGRSGAAWNCIKELGGGWGRPVFKKISQESVNGVENG